MIIFAVEPLSHCWNECLVLAEKHWKETEGYRHNQPFCPSFERYKQYEDIGCFFMTTARDEGKLVGYAGMYCTPSMHTQLIIATEDTYYLEPEYRKGRNAIMFYQFIEKESIKRGAVEMGMTAKLTNKAGTILEYLEFTHSGMQYTKNLTSADSVETHDVSEESSHVRPQASTAP